MDNSRRKKNKFFTKSRSKVFDKNGNAINLTASSVDDDENSVVNSPMSHSNASAAGSPPVNSPKLSPVEKADHVPSAKYQTLQYMPVTRLVEEGDGYSLTISPMDRVLFYQLLKNNPRMVFDAVLERVCDQYQYMDHTLIKIALGMLELSKECRCQVGEKVTLKVGQPQNAEIVSKIVGHIFPSLQTANTTSLKPPEYWAYTIKDEKQNGYSLEYERSSTLPKGEGVKFAMKLDDSQELFDNILNLDIINTMNILHLLVSRAKQSLYHTFNGPNQVICLSEHRTSSRWEPLSNDVRNTYRCLSTFDSPAHPVIPVIRYLDHFKTHVRETNSKANAACFFLGTDYFSKLNYFFESALCMHRSDDSHEERYDLMAENVLKILKLLSSDVSTADSGYRWKHTYLCVVRYDRDMNINRFRLNYRPNLCYDELNRLCLLQTFTMFGSVLFEYLKSSSALIGDVVNPFDNASFKWKQQCLYYSSDEVFTALESLDMHDVKLKLPLKNILVLCFIGHRLCSSQEQISLDGILDALKASIPCGALTNMMSMHFSAQFEEVIGNFPFVVATVIYHMIFRTFVQSLTQGNQTQTSIGKSASNGYFSLILLPECVTEPKTEQEKYNNIHYAHMTQGIDDIYKFDKKRIDQAAELLEETQKAVLSPAELKEIESTTKRFLAPNFKESFLPEILMLKASNFMLNHKLGLSPILTYAFESPFVPDSGNDKTTDKFKLYKLMNEIDRHAFVKKSQAEKFKFKPISSNKLGAMLNYKNVAPCTNISSALYNKLIDEEIESRPNSIQKTNESGTDYKLLNVRYQGLYKEAQSNMLKDVCLISALVLKKHLKTFKSVKSMPNADENSMSSEEEQLVKKIRQSYVKPVGAPPETKNDSNEVQDTKKNESSLDKKLKESQSAGKASPPKRFTFFSSSQKKSSSGGSRSKSSLNNIEVGSKIDNVPDPLLLDSVLSMFQHDDSELGVNERLLKLKEHLELLLSRRNTDQLDLNKF